LRILEFSDSHLAKDRSKKTEALLEIATEEKPDLLIGNGDVIDLWAEEAEVIANNPTVKKLQMLSKEIEIVLIVGNHDISLSALNKLFPDSKTVLYNYFIDGFWFEHGHLKDFFWQGFPLVRPIFDAHPEWAHWIYTNIYQRIREPLNRNPGDQKLIAEELKRDAVDGKSKRIADKKEFVFRQHARTMWYRALSFADWKSELITDAIVIGHDHTAGSWIQDYKPYLWDGGSIHYYGTYLDITDGEVELKKV